MAPRSQHLTARLQVRLPQAVLDALDARVRPDVGERRSDVAREILVAGLTASAAPTPPGRAAAP